MSANLEAIPTEVVEIIVCHLDVEDIGSLRLACRTLRSKASHGHFKTFFISKKVDLREPNVQHFAAVTRHGGLGCLIETLTITGVVYNTKALEALLETRKERITEHNGPIFKVKERQLTPDEIIKVQEDLELLRQWRAAQARERESDRDARLLGDVLNNICHNDTRPKLQSMSLDVVVYRDTTTRLEPADGGDYKQIWDTASRTYTATMVALASSSLLIQHLNAHGNMTRCSIPSNDVSAPAPIAGLGAALGGLKTLSLSLSNRIIEASDTDALVTDDPHDVRDGWCAPRETMTLDALVSLATDPSNYTGVAQLLAQAPQLLELDLHWYQLLCHSLSTVNLHFEQMLENIAAAAPLPSLRKCTLRGLEATEPSLLAFLHNSPQLAELELRRTVLVRGTWRPVFDYVSNESCIEALTFDDLFEQKLLYFDEEGTPKFPSMGNSWGVNTLTRVGKQAVKQSIGYHFSTGRPLGSPQAYRWRSQIQRDYGPPTRW
ncbi:hypothetical protein LTR50_006573 [Elasticomyces elasticus]|nr:hypothetical protein LTR50_006573 [Elasticomyces elasticus]